MKEREERGSKSREIPIRNLLEIFPKFPKFVEEKQKLSDDQPWQGVKLLDMPNS